MLWVVACTLHLIVCSYHVTYTFQIESRLSCCLNVKELVTQSRRQIWILSGCNWARTHKHLVGIPKLNHLAKLSKWLSWVLSTYLYSRNSVSNEFLDIEATKEAKSTLKFVRGMIRTYNQMHHTDENSKDSWSGCRFESSCSNLSFRFGACFEQRFPGHSGNKRV